MPEFATVAPVRIVNVPERNVKILPLAEKFPPVLIVNDVVGEKVTSLERVTFPLAEIVIFDPVYVPEPDTAEVESKVKFPCYCTGVNQS